jgi:predicted component of viral defense system (DUF524 family)
MNKETTNLENKISHILTLVDNKIKKLENYRKQLFALVNQLSQIKQQTINNNNMKTTKQNNVHSDEKNTK